MQTLVWTIETIEYSDSKEVVILHCKIEKKSSFQEGQFMLLGAEIDGKLVKRSYSISSTNQILQEKNIICFGIKRTSDGVFSTWAMQVAKIWDTITMTWPLGKFVDQGQSGNYLFLSVGSGLYPCLSLYDQLLQTDKYHKIVNLFGEKQKEHIPDSVISSFTITNDRIYNQICLSRIMHDQQPHLYRSGRIQGALDDALAFLWTHDISVFLCGRPDMCKEMQEVLLDKWIAKERIMIEKY